MCDPIQGGGVPPMKPVGQAPPTGGGGPSAPQQPTTPAPGTTVAGASGGSAGQAAAGASALGGGSTPGDLAGVLKALVDALNALVAALGKPPVDGGGGPKGTDGPGHAMLPAGIRKP